VCRAEFGSCATTSPAGSYTENVNEAKKIKHNKKSYFKNLRRAMGPIA
jgi:hypothetical protein